MKTCTLVFCFLLTAMASFAVTPAPNTRPAANAAAFTLCLEAEDSNGDGPVSADPNASNGGTRGARNGPENFVDYMADLPSASRYQITLRYYAEQNAMVNVFVNGDAPFQVELPASHSWNIVTKEFTFEVNLMASTNRIRIQELPGFDVRQDKVCWTEMSGCDFEIAPTAAASRYEVGATIGLGANCSGGQCDDVQFVWAGNGITREGRNIGTPAPTTPGIYTYELTATKPGCGSKTASVTVEVVIPPGCDFNVSASVSNANPGCSDPIILSTQCTGPDCAGVNYAWVGNGLIATNSSVTIPAPSVKGTYTYMVFGNKEGCGGKSSNVTVMTNCESGPTEPFSACVEAENSNSDGEITEDPNASNGKTRGTQNGPSYFVEYEVNGVKATGIHQVTLRYYATQQTGIIISVNGEETAPLAGLPASGSWNVVWAERTFSFTLKEGSNKIRIWSGYGYPVIRQDKICVSGSGGTGNPPSCDFNLTTGLSTTTPACSTSVFAGVSCSGFDCPSVSYQWSGNGVNSTLKSATITPPRANGTYTYTLTASKNACPPIVKTFDITVSGCSQSGPFSTCAEAEWSASNGPTSSDPNASNGQTKGAQDNYDYYVEYYVPDVPASGVYPVTLRYYAETDAKVMVSVNGNVAITEKVLPATHTWNIVSRDEILWVPLSVGNNAIRIQGLPGAACRQDKICVGDIQRNARMAIPALSGLPTDTPSLRTYPNPAPGEFKAAFYLEKGVAALLRVTDVQGKVWHTRNVIGTGSHEERITLDNAPAGIYLLQVKKPNSVETQKILLTR